MQLNLGTPLHLSHLPILMDVVRRTKMLDVIDTAIREDPRSKVSTSECVAVILCSVFAGAHDLWRLSERLGRFDMPTVMRDLGFNISEFTEERLAKALDDLWKVDVNRLMTGIALQMIEHFSLDMDFLHFDTTSLSFHGAYEREDLGSLGQEMPPLRQRQTQIPHGPKVCHGYSKDHRPDLKQIIYGTLMTADGGVPVAGRGMDGNHSDSESAAEFFTEIRKIVQDPRKVCCVADSKGWCSRVLGVIQDQGMRLLSRLPRTNKLHDTLMAKPWEPCGKIERPGKRKNDPVDIIEYQGFSQEEGYIREVAVSGYQADGTPNPPKNEIHLVKVRAVKIRSSALLRTKLKTAIRERGRERTKAQGLAKKIQAEAYACRRDAEQAVQELQDRNRWITIAFTAEVIRHEGQFKVGRGRPRKNPRPPIDGDHYFKLVMTVTNVDEATMRLRLIEDATFILIRTRNEDWSITDAEMIERYRGQYHNEHGFAWLKSGMGLNPLFLKTETRIGSLCFIYCLGLMVWNLLQRDVRANLKKNNTGLPYYRGKLSAKITTRFFFELFPQVMSIPVQMEDGTSKKHLAGFDEVVENACRAAGTSRKIFEPDGKW